MRLDDGHRKMTGIDEGPSKYHLFKIQSETSMSIRRSYRHSMNKNIPVQPMKLQGNTMLLQGNMLILPRENTTLRSWKADKLTVTFLFADAVLRRLAPSNGDFYKIIDNFRLLEFHCSRRKVWD